MEPNNKRTVMTVVLAPEPDPREPPVRVVAVLREPELVFEFTALGRLAAVARVAAEVVRSTKAGRFGRAGE